MSELQQKLSDLHRELSNAPLLDPDERAMLEATVAEIQRTLAQQSAAAPSAGTVSVAAPADTPADSLENAAVRLETGHPGLAGAVRAFVDALGKAGI